MHDAGGNPNYRTRMTDYDWPQNKVYETPTTHRNVVVAYNRIYDTKTHFEDGGAIHNPSGNALIWLRPRPALHGCLKSSNWPISTGRCHRGVPNPGSDRSASRTSAGRLSSSFRHQRRHWYHCDIAAAHSCSG